MKTALLYLSDESGVTAIEYGVIAALISCDDRSRQRGRYASENDVQHGRILALM
ncbi:MAG TPA: Flp family type IVb pilin [Rhizomicrobium sp.]|jgi:hypothetical protein